MKSAVTIALSFLLGAALSCGPALAEGIAAIGLVKRVSGSVLLDRAGKTLPVEPGMKLLAGDRIRTGADGLVGVTLSDDTLLSAGKGSSLLINDFRFDASTHEGGMLATLSRGSLHVVTGLIAKKTPEKVNIKTPSTVLGVRGTDFIVDVPGEIELQ